MFGKDSQTTSLITLVYFIFVFVFWWYYFYDATFKREEDYEPATFYLPSFSEIVETIGDFVGPTTVLGLALLTVLSMYFIKLL